MSLQTEQTGRLTNTSLARLPKLYIAGGQVVGVGNLHGYRDLA